MVPIRASDAILLSKIANIDIYMEEKLFKRQSVPYESGKSKVATSFKCINIRNVRKGFTKSNKRRKL